MQNESRRFRVKFAATSQCTGIEQCGRSVAVLRNHFDVNKINLDGATSEASIQVMNLSQFCTLCIPSCSDAGKKE